MRARSGPSLCAPACSCSAGCAFWALLPVVARWELGLDAFGYGALLGCVGLGAIGGAVLLPRLKRRLRLDAVVAFASLLFAACHRAHRLLAMPGLWLAMLVAGVAWIAILASLNAAAQTVASAHGCSRLSSCSRVALGPAAPRGG